MAHSSTAATAHAPAGHHDDALANAEPAALGTELASHLPNSAANADAGEPADDRSVRPLWMITIGLGGFFAVMAFALAIG